MAWEVESRDLEWFLQYCHVASKLRSANLFRPGGGPAVEPKTGFHGPGVCAQIHSCTLSPGPAQMLCSKYLGSVHRPSAVELNMAQMCRSSAQSVHVSDRSIFRKRIKEKMQNQASAMQKMSIDKEKAKRFKQKSTASSICTEGDQHDKRETHLVIDESGMTIMCAWSPRWAGRQREVGERSSIWSM